MVLLSWRVFIVLMLMNERRLELLCLELQASMLVIGLE